MQTFKFTDFLDRSGNEGNQLFDILDKTCLWPSKGTWLAGGAIRRTIIKQTLDSDLDYFFDSRQSLDAFKVRIEKLAESKEVKILSFKENEHNISWEIEILGWSDKQVSNKIKIQAIFISFYKDEKELLELFDFTICQFCYDGETLYCGDYSLWDLSRKRLVINTLTHPVATLRRLLKYGSQGFYACNGCLADILRRVADTPALIESRFVYFD